MSDLKEFFGLTENVQMSDAEKQWANSLVGRVYRDGHAHFNGKVIRWEPAKKRNTGVWVFSSENPEPRTFVKYSPGLGLGETFGPKPERASGAVGKDLPVRLGMNSFYETGEPTDEKVIRTLASNVYSIKLSTVDEFVRLWREGEKKQAALAGIAT